jgi:hypothetical protein
MCTGGDIDKFCLSSDCSFCYGEPTEDVQKWEDGHALPVCDYDSLRMFCLKQTAVKRTFEKMDIYNFAVQHCFPRLDDQCQVTEKDLHVLATSAYGKQEFVNRKMQMERDCWHCAVHFSPLAFFPDVGTHFHTPAPTPYTKKSSACCRECSTNKYSNKMFDGEGWCGHCPRGQYPALKYKLSKGADSPCFDCPRGYYSAVLVNQKSVSTQGAHMCYVCPAGKYGLEGSGQGCAISPTAVPTTAPTFSPTPSPTFHPLSIPTPHHSHEWTFHIGLPALTPTSSPTLPPTLSRRNALIAFYQDHDPSHVKNVDTLLGGVKFTTLQAVLLHKYGSLPEVTHLRQIAPYLSLAIA